MKQKTIIIAKPNLTEEEIRLSRRFLTESHRFSAKQWSQIRQLNYKLAGWSVLFQNKRYTFKKFYRTFINGTYAYPLLKALPQLTDIAKEGLKLQARAARKIVEWLRVHGIQEGKVDNAEYLVIYWAMIIERASLTRILSSLCKVKCYVLRITYYVLCLL